MNCLCPSEGARGKPSYLRTLWAFWTSPSTLRLSERELAALDPQLAAAVRAMRDKIGRIPVHYPPLVTSYSVSRSKAWRPRPSDVIVLTFHKTGTTWLQQIAHQLRTGGDTGFQEVGEIEPWIDFAWAMDQDLDAEQVANPRLFKSHARLSAVQEGCKYLVAIRDPVDTLVSLYSFFQQKEIVPPETSVDDFARSPLWLGDSVWGGNYWEYTAEYFLCRQLPSVFVTIFEELKRDLRTEIQMIARFMDIPCDEALLSKVHELSSMDWMLQHDELFSEGWFIGRLKSVGRSDGPLMKPGAKVTKGHKTKPTKETLSWMQEQWERFVTPATGMSSYQELKSVVATTATTRLA